ncbi:MAG: hypothetical protein WAX77_07240 [Methylococcaceae bacterium]
MSFLASFNKKSKLNSMIKQTEQARKSESGVADNLFKGAYQGYAEVLLDDSLRADALYHWGFALLHQAKTKSGDVASRLYRDAVTKFDFCLLLNPNYLGAAINGGVAYMDLARLLAVDATDELYDLAKKQFERANSIHRGTASYNLACICALREQQDGCRQALEHALNNGSLPDSVDILADADMDKVKEQQWFVDFITAITAPAVEEGETVAEATKQEAVETPVEQAAGSVAEPQVTEPENEIEEPVAEVVTESATEVVAEVAETEVVTESVDAVEATVTEETLDETQSQEESIAEVAETMSEDAVIKTRGAKLKKHH